MKRFMSGFFCSLLFVTLVSMVHADAFGKTISAIYDGIKIVINGNLAVPKDVNGNIVEPFVVDGTTYLPVRAISTTLGFDVNWDEDTKTIFIGEVPKAELEEVTVSNAKEFVNALKSNTRIIMKPGLYDISSIDLENPEQVYYQNVFDGSELALSKIINLEIVGSTEGTTEIVTKYYYANVITFSECRNITIKNIKAGHMVEKGACIGGVFNFEFTNNITIDSSFLYGCGTYGLYLNVCKDFHFVNSVIDDCTSGIMTLSECSNIKFEDSDFTNCDGYEMISLGSCEAISFNNCNITGNKAELPLIVNFNTKDVSFTDTKFEKNDTPYLANSKEIAFEGCTFKDNTFNENDIYDGLD